MSAATGPEGPVHTREQFEFIANAPLDIVWPLFGAEAERAWAPGWNPMFIWPATATDKEGMVFKVAHGDRTAVWVNTTFDQATNRIQYVYVIPDIVVTVITLRLKEIGDATHVAVIYERTALAAAASEGVSQMAADDHAAGPQWGEQINHYLLPSLGGGPAR